ncbi:hypothetical protein [Thermovibrio sp.]
MRRLRIKPYAPDGYTELVADAVSKVLGQSSRKAIKELPILCKVDLIDLKSSKRV